MKISDLSLATLGTHKFWRGTMDHGLFVKIRGAGLAWDNPLYSKDFPTIPFVPPTWGGVGAVDGKYGVNITDNGSTYVAFSGPRSLSASSPSAETNFQFDMAVTPARPVDMVLAYRQRQIQIGYSGQAYVTPAEAAAMGATVVNLHQGIHDVVNGSMINRKELAKAIPLALPMTLGVFLLFWIRSLHQLSIRTRLLGRADGQLLSTG
jgi:hypothetical protein